MRRQTTIQCNTPEATALSIQRVESAAIDETKQIRLVVAYRWQPVFVAAQKQYLASPWDLVVAESDAVIVLPSPDPSIAGVCIAVVASDALIVLVKPLLGMIDGAGGVNTSSRTPLIIICDGTTWW
jgi:hypothetical protein